MMKHDGTQLFHRLCVSGLGLILLLGSSRPAPAAPSYRAAPQGIEVPADLERYDPAVLQITFGEQPDAGTAEMPWRISGEQPPETDDFFDPTRLPDNTSDDSHKAAHTPDTEERPGLSQSTSVPEPGTFALLGLGLSALILAFRRKRS